MRHHDNDLKIRKYIRRNYPELAGCKISIGQQGNTYRLLICDPFHVLHTIHVDITEVEVTA